MNVSNEADTFRTVRWIGDAATGFLRLIDQTRLPMEFVEIDCRDVPAVWEAIKVLRVRGAPAIGIAAAYGAVIGARSQGDDDGASVVRALGEATAHLRTSRPTAVNLFWALDRMDACVASVDPGDGPAILDRLLERGPQDRRRRPCHVPGDRSARGTPGRAGAGDLDPLQCRRPGHRRLWDRPGRGLRRTRAGHAAARLRRRDEAAAPGGSAHRLGAHSGAESPSR